MRMQFRFLLYFIPLLMFLFSSSIIAKNWELVDITIPAWEDVTSKSQYTHPTKEFANKMTDWSDDCVRVTMRLPGFGMALSRVKRSGIRRSKR